jgi:hypothetical protein
MIRPTRAKSPGTWWRGYGMYAAVAVFWFMVIGIWLALLVGSKTTGATIPGNPVVAVSELLLGHMHWPGNWSTAFVVLEAGFLAVLTKLVRGALVARAGHASPSGDATSD